MAKTDDWSDTFPAAAPAVPDVYDPEQYATRPATVERPAADRAKAGPNQATEIVQLARAKYDVVRGDDSKTYAVAHTLPGVAFGLRGSGGLRQQLAAAYYDEKARAASGGALQDALAVLEGDALRADETGVHLRVGRSKGAVFIDRATPDGHAVKVTPKGWELVDRSPILFRRTPVSSAMPAPERGGDLEQLRALINVDEKRFHLVVAWLVAAYLPEIAHPILALTGQQGTAKTTAARIILSLVDPSAASLQSQPRTPEDWAIAAYNVYGVGLDNVSRLPGWLQDALCKAVTGDAFVRRELYSDDSVTVLRYRRPIALTTIDPGALQGDVADRLLLVELAPISTTDRRTEADVTEALDALRPSTLGVLFDLLAKVLKKLPSVNLIEKPRMADFAEILAALDDVTGWTTLTDYLAATVTAARDVLDSDPFGTALVGMVTARGRWEGTCLDLLSILADEKHTKDYPETARAVAARLTRITPALTAANVTVRRRLERSNHGAVYIISHDLAPLCTICELEINAELAAGEFTNHPTCTQPIYDDLEPF